MASPAVTCQGCIENQPNQLAHMEEGGCLYVPEEPYDVEEEIAQEVSHTELIYTKMVEYIGKDVYNHRDIRPVYSHHCPTDSCGIHAHYTIEDIKQVLEEFPPETRPNIAVKNGKRGKWWLKRCPEERIQEEQAHCTNPNAHNCRMYVFTY